MNIIRVTFNDGSSHEQPYTLEVVAMWVKVNNLMAEQKEFPEPHIKLIEIF